MTQIDAPILIHPSLQRLRMPALIAGIAGLLLCALGYVMSGEHKEQFYLSYLVGYLLWLGIPLGSMGLLMVQYLTGGAWGLSIRRLLECGTRLILLMAILFLPMFLGIDHLYEWANGHGSGAHEHSAGGYHWLTKSGFIIRAIIYFALWIVWSYILNAWSLRQDRYPEKNLRLRFQRFSSLGILMYAMTMTLASVDWVMSLDSHWVSTMYGLILIIGQALSALAFAVAVLVILADREPLKAVLSENVYHDLGNLLLATTMLWAYFAFSQFLIIWSGNLAEETPFYIYRTTGFWKWIALFLIVFHFAVPFAILLNRVVKRNPAKLARVALLLVAVRVVDLVFIIFPHYTQGRSERLLHEGTVATAPLSWIILPAVIGIGGIWIFFYIAQLGRRPLLPLHDPQLDEMAEAHHHG